MEAWKSRKVTVKPPAHLGGHGNKTHIDKGCLELFKRELGIQSVLDVGSGTGGMREVCEGLDLAWTGIDGDPYVDSTITHDYVNGKSPVEGKFDLGWCCGVAEHIEEKYLHNFMADLDKCKYVAFFPAGPGYEGYHHVNLKNKAWWSAVFEGYGFERDIQMEALMDQFTTMSKKKIFNLRMFFKR